MFSYSVQKIISNSLISVHASYAALAESAMDLWLFLNVLFIDIAMLLQNSLLSSTVATLLGYLV